MHLYMASINNDRYPNIDGTVYVRATSSHAAMRWLLTHDDRFRKATTFRIEQLPDLIEVPEAF